MKNVDRAAEEQYLRQTMKVVRDNVENYESEVSRMQSEIDEMLEHYHDNDVELWSALNNTITLNEHMKRALERNRRALEKPYFGRIIFYDETLGKTESLYIGKGGISADRTSQVVVDWRAPVANAYYENGLGKCSYTAPDGRELPIDLKLKRNFEIDGGELLDYFDTEVVANDDLLMKYLSKNKEAVLGEIVATIQKEQNEIIRKSPYHNVIVQGVAGSGKTTVAMHRISYILYNYKERFRPEDFYIVGSNRILLNYITGVLPDLDVHGVRQMTMEQLFIRLLYEDWDEKRCRVKTVAGEREAVKGTEQWYEELVAFIRRLEWEVIPREDVFLNPGEFDEEPWSQGRKPVELMSREAVERYIRQNPSVSIQSKINMLNERLLAKLKNEFLGEHSHYTEEGQKAILKACRGRYGGRQWTRSVYDMYRDFLIGQRQKGYDVTIPADTYDVYDLAALALLYKLVKETEVISEAHHVVIDEAQDFGMMVYRVLNDCIKDCTYTVMGDVSQNIHFGYGLGDWEALRGLLLQGAGDSFGVLKKSYRNTVEISDFATGILRHGNSFVYPVEPIIRHGNPVRVEQIEIGDSQQWMNAAGGDAFARRAAEICGAWQKEGYDTIAVVCRDADAANWFSGILAQYIDIMESDLEKASFGSGILVLPVEYTKGLEFDAVLILNPTREDYPVDDGHARLLYVAATRALHELCVLHGRNLTGLLTEPAAENRPEDKGEGKEENKIENRVENRAENKTENKTENKAGNKAESKLENQVNNRTSRRAKVVAAAPQTLKVRTAAKETPASVRPATNYGTAALPPKTRRDLTEKAVETARMDKTGSQFGDMPATELLRPSGHAKINLNVRWAFRESDGLHLQSQYGLLCISPVGSAILRITFVKGSQIREGVHPSIAVKRVEKNWKYRDNGKIVEISAGEITAQLDKTSGTLRFVNGAGRLLFSERRQDCRMLEQGGSRWYLEFGKGETLCGIGETGREPLKLRGSARYISRGDGALPFLISDRDYGILPAADGLCFCCDVPVYGSYLYTEGEQMDYYVIAGKRQNLLGAYAWLCGLL